MINIDTMIRKEIENGYGDANAQAKVCQDIDQEEYCFDIAYDDEGASLLINTNEQMIAEKLRSLLRLGTLSTRYKDVFDIYYLCQHADIEKLSRCLSIYIFDDPAMREKDIGGVYKRISNSNSLTPPGNPVNRAFQFLSP